jgi:hypothetical protein
LLLLGCRSVLPQKVSVRLVIVVNHAAIDLFLLGVLLACFTLDATFFKPCCKLI